MPRFTRINTMTALAAAFVFGAVAATATAGDTEGTAPNPDEEVVIHKGGEKPRSGGRPKEGPVGDDDEVIIYKGGEEPRSGGHVPAR